MWSINAGLIKGFCLGLSYEDDPEVIEYIGLSFAIIIEIGFLRINLFKHLTEEEDDS